MYVKVENNMIIESVPRPDWRDNDGNPVSDSVLVQNGYYPVDYETYKPQVDPFYQTAVITHRFLNWEISSNKVIARYNIEEQTLEEKKEELKRIVKMNFKNKQKEGYFSQVINARINSERDDLDNMRSLLDYMNKNNIASVNFRAYDNSFVSVNESQLQEMINELVQYGILLYNTKWQIEETINAAVSMEELKLIDTSI